MARVLPIDDNRQRLPSGMSARPSDGVRCPACSSATSSVVDSRVCRGGIRRARNCDGCGARFRTVERVSTLIVPGRRPHQSTLDAEEAAATIDDVIPGWIDLTEDDRAFVSRMVAAVAGRRDVPEDPPADRMTGET